MAQQVLGFTTTYQVNHITSIKPTPSGNINGTAYDASVKVRSSVIEMVNDKKLGLIEKEKNIEFNIPCDDSKLRDFNVWLRKQQKDNKPIIISAGLPYGSGKEVLTTKSYLTGEEMMATEHK